MFSERQFINSSNIQDMRDVVGGKRHIEVAVVWIAHAHLSARALAIASRDICRAAHRSALGSGRSRVADDAG